MTQPRSRGYDLYLHDVVDVLDGAEALRPQLQPRGHLQLCKASLQVQLDAIARPPLPPAKTVRRLTVTTFTTGDISGCIRNG